MTLKTVLIAALTVALLGGCANYQNNPKETGGALLGAAAGGLVGSQFGHGSGGLAATAVGALLGAWVGSEIGHSMDQVDRVRAQQAHVQALDTGQTIHWDNPNNGDHGKVVPLRSGTNTQTGAFCREFQSTVIVGGKEQQAYGTACRQPDGSWRITNN